MLHHIGWYRSSSMDDKCSFSACVRVHGAHGPLSPKAAGGLPSLPMLQVPQPSQHQLAGSHPAWLAAPIPAWVLWFIV